MEQVSFKKLLIIITLIIFIVGSLLYLAASMFMNAAMPQQAEQKEPSTPAVQQSTKQKTTISEVSPELIQKDINFSSTIVIKEQAAVQDVWRIALIAPADGSTDTAAVIYKQQPGGAFVRIAGPSTSFYRKTLLAQGIPEPVVNHAIITRYLVK